MSPRKLLIVALGLGILAAPLAPHGQPPAKIPRIGYLVLAPLAEKPSPERAAFLEGLRELGYVEGKTVAIEYRSAGWNAELLPDLAEELVRLKVDVIVTSLMAPELGSKRLELLKEAVPRISRVAVLWHPRGAGRLEWQQTEAAARRLGVALQSYEVRNADDLARTLEGMSRQRPDAVIMFFDPLTSGYRVIISDFALKNRLPTICGAREFAAAGGLMSYGPNIPELFRRAAVYVDKILKGSRPGELPIEQPTKFELIVNLKTAKALGLTIPPSVLIRADQVVQ